jgi:hypothetical protein
MEANCAYSNLGHMTRFPVYLEYRESHRWDFLGLGLVQTTSTNFRQRTRTYIPICRRLWFRDLFLDVLSDCFVAEEGFSLAAASQSLYFIWSRPQTSSRGRGAVDGVTADNNKASDVDWERRPTDGKAWLYVRALLR